MTTEFLISLSSDNIGVFSHSASGTSMDYITINTTGNALTFGNLTVIRNQLQAASNGANNRGVYAGGNNGTTINTIDYITISTLGNAIDFGDLTVNKNSIKATSNS